MSLSKKSELYFDGRVYFDAYLTKENICSQWIWILPLSYSLRVIDDGGKGGIVVIAIANCGAGCFVSIELSFVAYFLENHEFRRKGLTIESKSDSLILDSEGMMHGL